MRRLLGLCAVFGMAVGLCMPNVSDAGRCQVAAVVETPVVAAPVVAATVAVPVAVPVIVPAAVFQFVPSAMPTVTAPAAVAHNCVPVASVKRSRASAPMPCSPEHIERLVQERLDARLGRTTGNSGLPMALDPNESVSASPVNPPNRQVFANTGDFAAILERRCSKCHTGSTSKGNTMFFTSPGILAPVTRERLALAVIEAEQANMPPDAKGDPDSPFAVTNAELDILKSQLRKQ